jgi:hypothetical protein
MQLNGKKKQKFPTGWGVAKVQKVIDHYERQTDEERLAEIQDAAVAEAERRFAQAVKHFNGALGTNQSKLIWIKNPKKGREEVVQLFGHDQFGLLNWTGADDEGVFNEYYEVRFAAQLPTMDFPFRPVLCTISKRLKHAMELRRSQQTLLEVWTACMEGVNLQLGKRKNALVIVGVRTSIYAKSIDSETLIDSLIRLNQSIPDVAKSQAS